MIVAILKQKFCDHYRFYASLFIFIIILCCLYLPFYIWGLFADDFGIIRHVMDVGFKKIGTFFYEGETFSAVLNPNYVNTLDNFLGGLYRPMVFIYSLLQVHFFGPNPSAYLFVSIFLHSLNSVFLFNIIYTFEKTFAAVVLALCFAFHSSLFNWLGWFSGQQYIIELTCLILILLTLKKYIVSQKYYFYFLSMFLYLLNVFQREMMVVFPFWVVFFCSFYNIRGLKLSCGYFFALFTYIISRGLVFSFNIKTTSNATLMFDLNFKSFILRMSERFYDFVTILSDYLGLRILPQNHQFVKGGLIAIFIGVLVFLFLRNSKKGLVILTFISCVMFSWIPILLTHQPRYIYVGLFFFMISLALLYHFSDLNKNCKKCLLVLVLAYISINYVCLAHGMEYCRIKYSSATEKLKKLGSNINLILKKSKSFGPIYFHNLPADFTFATNQAIRLYSDCPRLQVYETDDKAKYKINGIEVTWDDVKNDFHVEVIH